MADPHETSLTRPPQVDSIPIFSELVPKLEKRYSLFTLTGQTLTSLLASGHTFQTDRISSGHEPYVIEDGPSLRAQVAVALQPGRLILPGTKNQSWETQLAFLDRYKQEVESEMPGMTVIPGNAADIAEIVFSHFTATGEYLFGPNFHHISTRTTTNTFDGRNPLGMVTVGSFYDSKKGLTLGRYLPESRWDHIGLVPLLVPIEAAKERQNSKTQSSRFTI